MTIGVLTVQGDYSKHLNMLSRIGVDSIGVKTRRELGKVDGLIIPGGESTTIMKMLRAFDMETAVRDFAGQKPVFGTCAGAIILAKKLANPDLGTLAVMDITVNRNAYGTQVDSFIDTVNFRGSKVEAIFIRAPKIIGTGPGTEILIRHGDDPVLVREKNLLACTFHPELTDDDTIHRYFLEMF